MRLNACCCCCPRDCRFQILREIRIVGSLITTTLDNDNQRMSAFARDDRNFDRIEERMRRHQTTVSSQPVERGSHRREQNQPVPGVKECEYD